jgi:hypothetical protein
MSNKSKFSKSKVSKSQVKKNVFGIVEEVLIFEENIKFKAKLDTGAKNTSLSAIDIRESKDKSTGKTCISFKIVEPSTGKLIRKKFQLKRYVAIKQHKKDINEPLYFFGFKEFRIGIFKYIKKEESMKRPVIMLPICLGNQRKIIEVNLVDRSHFKFPVLLGKQALKLFNVVVDPSKKFTSTLTTYEGK